jgi:hypothetical protein
MKTTAGLYQRRVVQIIGHASISLTVESTAASGYSTSERQAVRIAGARHGAE